MVKAKTITDEGLDELRWFICLLDDATLRRIDAKNWWLIPNFVEPDEIIFGFHLQYLHFSLPPLLHYFFALTGIHLIQVNANSIVVLNALFVLDFLHDKDLDLNFIASTYDIKAIKHKAYLSFSLQPKRNFNVFAWLPKVTRHGTMTSRAFMLLVGIGFLLPLIPNNFQFLGFLPKVRFLTPFF